LSQPSDMKRSRTRLTPELKRTTTSRIRIPPPPCCSISPPTPVGRPQAELRSNRHQSSTTLPTPIEGSDHRHTKQKPDFPRLANCLDCPTGSRLNAPLVIKELRRIARTNLASEHNLDTTTAIRRTLDNSERRHGKSRHKANRRTHVGKGS